MRKYDEGYALPFAVVVMLVLGVVVASILPFSLQNFKNQQASIERMQDKYEAQGEVEKAIAPIISKITGLSNNKASYNNRNEAVEEVKTELNGIEITWTDDYCSCSFSRTVQHGSIKISCTIVLNDVIVSQDSVFKIQKPTITYESYTVTYLDTPASAETTEVTP